MLIDSLGECCDNLSGSIQHISQAASDLLDFVKQFRIKKQEGEEEEGEQEEKKSEEESP